MPRCPILEDGQPCGAWTNRHWGVCQVHEEEAIVERVRLMVEARRITAFGGQDSLDPEPPDWARQPQEAAPPAGNRRRGGPWSKAADAKAGLTARQLAHVTESRRHVERRAMATSKRLRIPRRPGESSHDYVARCQRMGRLRATGQTPEPADQWPGWQQWWAQAPAQKRKAAKARQIVQAELLGGAVLHLLRAAGGLGESAAAWAAGDEARDLLANAAGLSRAETIVAAYAAGLRTAVSAPRARAVAIPVEGGDTGP